MTARRRFRLMIRGLVCAVLIAGSTGAGAQVRVTSGEHDGFTRLVLQARAPFAWSLAAEGRERRLRVDAALRFDPAEVFRVIPRTRLADLRRTAEGLALVLNCDCAIRAFEPAAGVVVLDIGDGPPRARPVPGTRDHAGTPPDLARAAGGDLARRMRATPRPAAAPAAAPGAAAPEGPAPALTGHLARQLSQAVAQGLLVADPAHRATPVPPAEAQPAGVDLSNLRISLAAGALGGLGALGGRAPATAGDACPEPDLFARDGDELPFAARHSRLLRTLYGEFDLPDAGSHEALARLYLEHGFGAEARLVIENAPARIAGRDLLLGLSDILENRHSNARRRLSERIDCAGTIGLLAALAGADPARTARRAMQIAGAYAELPAALRHALGEALVRRLLAAQAREAARMVADTLRRTPGVAASGLSLLDALIDAARGEVDRAAAHLDQAGSRDAATLVVRLHLALERGERLAPSLLADAEAVAAGERATATGVELMSLLIRAHNAAQETTAAFALLDRLERWRPAGTEGAATLAGLRDATWAGLAAGADDRSFLRTFLERSDWRDDALAAPTRLALAERLAAFGLAGPAGELLAATPAPAAPHLRARLLLLEGDPAAALELLAGREDAEALDLRSEAGRALRAAEAAPSPPLPPDAAGPPAGADQPPADRGLMLRGTTLLSESALLRDSLQDLLRPER